jgi:hypothetical protein
MKVIFMKKFLLNITFVALALGSHCSAAQPKPEQSLTLSEGYDTWLETIDYGDKEERPAVTAPSHKQKITTIPSTQEVNSAACSNAINNSEKTPQPKPQSAPQQQPSCCKHALQALTVGTLTAITLGVLSLLAGPAPFSDVSGDSDQIESGQRLYNIQLARQLCVSACATGLVAGGLGYKHVGALYKKIKSWVKSKNSASASNISSQKKQHRNPKDENKEPADQKQVTQQAEEAYQKAFDALKLDLEDLYLLQEDKQNSREHQTDCEEEYSQKAIDDAWAFRHATDTLYRAMHPNALRDGIDAAEKFIQEHFNGKIESLEKPQTPHGQFLYDMFMKQVTEISKSINETSHGIRRLVSSAKANATEIQVAKGNYQNMLKLFHPVDSPTKCLIEIEICLKQLNANLYQMITAPVITAPDIEPKKHTLLEKLEKYAEASRVAKQSFELMLTLLTNAQLQYNRNDLTYAAFYAYLYLTSIAAEHSSSWYNNSAYIFNRTKQELFQCIKEEFNNLYEHFIDVYTEINQRKRI